VDEKAEFLAGYPPFDRLEASDLEQLTAAIRERRVAAGEVVLVEDGPPAQWVYVIRAGSMELLHEDEVIDVLTRGELFGHPSLLTGMAPSFTVRAREASTLYLLPPGVAFDLFGRPGGAAFVAETLRERLTRTGHTVHALPEVRTIRVGALVGGPPVFCEPDDSIRDAARAMRERHSSAVLVRTRDGLGIVTDTDLRDEVVAGDVSADAPVARIATVPVATISPDRLAVEASLEMMDAGIHHLPVVDAGGGVLGVVSAAELLNLENLSPFAIRRSIGRARDEDELVAAVRHLPKVFVALLDEGLEAPEVSRVLALQSDSATVRLIELAMDRHGPPPVAYAWLALGSVARRELTLASDQDNALAYADAGAGVDDYFARVASDVNAGLARCGFGADAADVLASNRQWRMSESEWLRTFAECYETPDRSHLVRAAVSFDFRHVVGGLQIVPPLVELVQAAPRHPDFLARLARTATDLRPPLGFRRRLPEHLDIKRGGVVPIANLARFHALANGITISRTLDRLVAVEELGGLDRDLARGLREAFTIVTRVRLQHHAAQIEAGTEPDNLIDPGELPPLARLDLQEALRAVADAQKRLSHFVPLGL
jgi:CBS domain-containing protein